MADTRIQLWVMIQAFGATVDDKPPVPKGTFPQPLILYYSWWSALSSHSPVSHSSSDPESNVYTKLLAHERLLWALAVLAYGIGDSLTTFVGLEVSGVVEAGPIAGPAIEHFGRGGLLLIKGILFTTFATVYAILSTPGRVAIPLALIVVGIAVSAWNSMMIWSAL